MLKRYATLLFFIAPFVLTGVLYAIFYFTDPGTVDSWVILGVFFLVYLICLSILFLLLRFGLFWLAFLPKAKNSNGTRPKAGMSQKKAYYVASILAFVPVSLLAMHAFSGVRPLDVGLIGFFVVVAIFYVVKRQ